MNLKVMEENMRFHEKHFEIPQVCLDLAFEDRSYHNDQSARMYNPQLDLTLWVNEPNASKKRYVTSCCLLPARAHRVFLREWVHFN